MGLCVSGRGPPVLDRTLKHKHHVARTPLIQSQKSVDNHRRTLFSNANNANNSVYVPVPAVKLLIGPKTVSGKVSIIRCAINCKGVPYHGASFIFPAYMELPLVPDNRPTDDWWYRSLLLRTTLDALLLQLRHLCKARG